MKTIVLIPVKNEEWIIRNTLENITPHVDRVIVADQKSTDRTVEICASFANVTIIQNPYEGHSNKVRWDLLEHSRSYGDGNLIICIDADEILPPAAIQEMKDAVASGIAQKGDVFRFQWVQLWKNVRTYMNHGVWKDSFKNIAFVDNPGINEYKKDFVINDHTSRVPDSTVGKEILLPYPLLHFHFVAWKRNQMKQAWYRCTELINGARNAKRINNTYRVTLMPKHIETFPVPEEWIRGLDLPAGLEDTTSNWHLEAIDKFFDTHGILFFEDLQIWHVPELHDRFVKEIGREPKSKAYPAWLVFINEIKNRIKNLK